MKIKALPCMGALLFAISQTAFGQTVIDSVTIFGPASDPTVEISGSGFGTEPVVEENLTSIGLTGDDFPAEALSFVDNSTTHQAFQAGYPSNLIGLIVTNYTDTKITYKFGSGLTDEYSSLYYMENGDPYQVTVNGVKSSGTIDLSDAPEPSIYSLLLGGMVLAALAFRMQRGLPVAL